MTAPDPAEIRRYYDEFVATFVRDHVWGNRRVDFQRALLTRALPPDVARVLVVGCGGGDTARDIAADLRPGADVTGVDISPRAIALARGLFDRPNLRFEVCDVTAESPRPDGPPWDAAVLPDVYEHIPPERRDALCAHLDPVLTGDATVAVTVPSPAHQQHLRDTGGTLQLVDEDITDDDLLQLADGLGGALVHRAFVSVWRERDYVHAVIVRGAPAPAEVGPDLRFTIPASGPLTVGERLRRRLLHHTGLARLRARRRRRRVERVLAELAETEEPAGPAEGRDDAAAGGEAS